MTIRQQIFLSLLAIFTLVFGFSTWGYYSYYVSNLAKSQVQSVE